MVSEFLKSRLVLHEKHINDLKTEERELEIYIDETTKFISILTQSYKDGANSFSPYSSVEEDQNKIIELREALHNAKDNLVALKNIIDEEKAIVNQYKSVIIEAENLEKGNK